LYPCPKVLTRFSPLTPLWTDYSLSTFVYVEILSQRGSDTQDEHLSKYLVKNNTCWFKYVIKGI